MPVISTEGGSPVVVGTVAAAAQSTPVLPAKSPAGVSPELNPSVLSPTPASAAQSVSTTPLSPLSPVFSAVSAEPLQPQTANAPKLPAGDVPASSTAPSAPNLADYGSDFGDKYAALADLDSAFSSGDPAKASSTSINWGASDTTEEECEEAESVVTQNQGQDRVGGGVASETHQTQFPPTPTTPRTDLNPFLSHTRTQSQTDANLDLGGDKYAALADLDSTTSLPSAVNWGPSQSAEAEESEDKGSSPGESPAGGVVVPGGHPMQDRSGGVNRSNTGGGNVLAGVAGLGSAPGVISSSPPSPSMMAAQAQMYGASAQPVVYGPQVTMGNMGYCPPSPMYNGPPTPHPGFAPPPAGFIYPQYPPQHGSQPVSAGYPGVPATYPGMAPPVGFAVPPQGAGWVQGGNVAPSTTHSSANPFMGSGQVAHGQAPVCMS